MKLPAVRVDVQQTRAEAPGVPVRLEGALDCLDVIVRREGDEISVRFRRRVPLECIRLSSQAD